MTAEERWEYVSGYGPWVKSFRCTACGFVSDIRSPRDRCDICAAITAAVEDERKSCEESTAAFVKLECEAAVEKRERELINEVCFYACGMLDAPPVRVIGHCGKPEPGNDWAWWFHTDADDEKPTDGIECPASPLHEAIHQRDPAAAEVL